MKFKKCIQEIKMIYLTVRICRWEHCFWLTYNLNKKIEIPQVFQLSEGKIILVKFIRVAK
jgi:hypothetical protein